MIGRRNGLAGRDGEWRGEADDDGKARHAHETPSARPGCAFAVNRTYEVPPDTRP